MWKLRKESLNSDGHQLQQYQQNEPSPLILTAIFTLNVFCHYIINIRFTIVLYAIIISTVRAGLKIIFHQMIYKMDFPADILFFSPSALKFDVRFYLSERVIVQSCLTPIVHFSIYIIARTSINYMRMR